ncbi:MAG: cytochrome P450 [Bosea sp. (in: a-proteobacteria)]
MSDAALATCQPRPFRPPAPQPHADQLNRLQLLLALRRNPLTIWRRAHFEELSLSGPGMFGYGVFLADPAAIRHVLVDNVANYRKDDLQIKVLSPGLGDGLLTAEGDAWRRARRTVAPLFTPKRVAVLAEAMKPPVDAHVARLMRRRPGHVLDVSQLMTTLTYDVLAETLFSNVISGGAAAFGAALSRYFETQGQIDPLDIFNAPSWLPRIGRIRAQPSINFFERTVREIVASRTGLIERGDTPPPDLLSALIAARDPENGNGLSDVEIGANIVTFIGAGHETTANVLTWSLYLLARAPHIREEVEREATNAGDDVVAAALDGNRLAMTRAVIEEAMRLYPPVATLTRSAKEADTAVGIDIPKGALVVIPPYVIHRHKKLWDQPNSFVPERFLPGQRIDRFAYLPFGAGPRICVGMQFAMVEAMIALSTLTRALRFDYAADSEPEPMQRITLRPKDGMPMTVSAR